MFNCCVLIPPLSRKYKTILVNFKQPTRRLAVEVISQSETKSAQSRNHQERENERERERDREIEREREKIMASIMATSLRLRTHFW